MYLWSWPVRRKYPLEWSAPALSQSDGRSCRLPGSAVRSQEMQDPPAVGPAAAAEAPTDGAAYFLSHSTSSTTAMTARMVRTTMVEIVMILSTRLVWSTKSKRGWPFSQPLPPAHCSPFLMPLRLTRTIAGWTNGAKVTKAAVTKVMSPSRARICSASSV